MVSINHELDIIYFHIPKTAGTYIQDLLENYYNFCSYNFLIRTDFHIFNETNKKKINKIDKINNYIENYIKNDKINNYIENDIKNDKINNYIENDIENDIKNDKINNYINEMNNYIKVTPFSNRLFGVNNYYSGSIELINMTTLDENRWKNALKFTFVRNPYSRFISAVNFILSIPHISENLLDNDNYGKFENIEYFIDNKDELSDIAYNHIFLSQYDQIINVNGINDINFIGKTENLEEDLSNFLLKNGFNNIIHEKKIINKNKINFNYYKTYYTEYIFNFVNKHFNKDFIEFNYIKYNNYQNFIMEL